MDEEKASSSSPKLIKSCFIDKPHVLLIDGHNEECQETAQKFEAESWEVTMTSTIKDGLEILENKDGVPNKMPKIGLVCLSIPRVPRVDARMAHFFARRLGCRQKGDDCRQKGDDCMWRGAFANSFAGPCSPELLDEIKQVAAASKDVPFVVLTSCYLNSNSTKLLEEAGAPWHILKPVMRYDVDKLMKTMDLEPYNVLEFEERKKKRTRQNPRTLNIG